MYVGNFVTSHHFLKSGRANSCPSDCRPVTITPVLFKVFEHLLAKLLNNFAEKNNFPNLQFGFCKGLGTCDALLTLSAPASYYISLP